ncbi:unnamed protein product, partial [Rotaria socialis]
AKSDRNENQADESNMDGESDNETNTTSASMITESNSYISQGSSGLLLLAAAAEQKRKDEEDIPNNRPSQSAPMEITYSSKLSDTNSSITGCLSPSSLASQFSQSIGFSPTSAADDLNSRLSRHVFLQNQNLMKTTTTVPLISSSPTTNLLLSIKQTPNHFDLFHHQQQPHRHDQQTIVESSTNTRSTNTTTNHVLCR